MLDPLRPYLWMLQLAIGIAMMAGCGWVGWELRAGKAEKEQGALQDRIGSLESSLTDFIGLYDRVTAETEQAKREADAWKLRANDEGKLAADRHRRLVVQLQALEDELEVARADEDCRAQLETPLCALLY